MKLAAELKESAEFKDIKIKRVGDCVAPRLIQSTITKAFTLSRRYEHPCLEKMRRAAGVLSLRVPRHNEAESRAQ
jgi:hypothetical protein